MNDQELAIFSRQWYDEYYRRAASSAASAQFCERVYGRDLCQHGMMDMQELDFLVSLIEPGVRILEIGCGNGRISAYIYERSKPALLLGLDFSAVAIEQARALAQTSGFERGLRFAQVDLKQAFACGEPAIPGETCDVIISIDSIYFLGKYQDTLPHLSARLAPGGRLLLAAFQFQAGGDPPEILTPEGTQMAQALRALGLRYQIHDFTSNLLNHWRENQRVAEELKDTFIQEDNEFLYQARRTENVEFVRAMARDGLARYMYVVEKG